MMALDNDCQFSASITREKRASHYMPYIGLTQYYLCNRITKENSANFQEIWEDREMTRNNTGNLGLPWQSTS